MQKQKGFISIPILIIIIASIVVVSVGTGVVLHKQGKLVSIVASVSQVFKRTEDTTISEREGVQKEEQESEKNQLESQQPLEIASQPDSQSIIESQAQPQAQSETELQLESEFESELELEAEPWPELAPEPESEAEIDSCVNTDCSDCQYCLAGDCINRTDGYNDCGSGCQRCINGSCEDYYDACSKCQYCSSDICVDNCEGTDTSCGCTSCANCNASDGCISNDYYDYYCSSTSCVFHSYLNDFRCISCTPHASYSCDGSAVYWYNSYGEKEGIKESCGICQYCLDGHCYNYCQNTDISCGCTSCFNCNNFDGWTDVVPSMSLPYCDGNKSCTSQKQEYRDYYCPGISGVYFPDKHTGSPCSYLVTDTRTNEGCTECGSSKYCSNGTCFDKPTKQCEWIWQGTISGSSVSPSSPIINCTIQTESSTGYILGMVLDVYDGGKYLSTSIESSPGSTVHRFLCKCK